MNIEERQKYATKMLNGARDTFMVVAPKMRREFVQTELDEEHLDFTLDGIPFSIYWGERLRPSIGHSVYVVQFTLSVWHQTYGGRWHPPENIDKELVTTQNISECVKKAFMTVFENEFDNIMSYCHEEDKVEEEM